MNKPIRLINLGQVSSWKTQAVYHALAERMTEDSLDTIIVCQPDSPYLCLGHFQSYDSIFDRQEVERLKLVVYRRRIGGGATYLDKNQLFYQFIFHHSRVPFILEKTYKTFLAAPIETLKTFGLNCQLRALNEIEIDGKRIAGIGGGRIGDASVVVGNFLIDFNYEIMSSVWKSPWQGYKELAKEAIKERVYTLKQCAPKLTIKKVSNKLIEMIPKYFNRPILNGDLSIEEIGAAQKVSEQLISKNVLDMGDDVDKVKDKPLKISADVFIYNKKILMNKREINIAIRTDKDIITSIKVGRDFAINEKFIGKKLKEIEPLFL